MNHCNFDKNYVLLTLQNYSITVILTCSSKNTSSHLLLWPTFEDMKSLSLIAMIRIFVVTMKLHIKIDCHKKKKNTPRTIRACLYFCIFYFETAFVSKTNKTIFIFNIVKEHVIYISMKGKFEYFCPKFNSFTVLSFTYFVVIWRMRKAQKENKLLKDWHKSKYSYKC